MVKFRILGPIECYCGERRCELGGPRQLALLAVLVLNSNRAVSADALIDAVWGDQSSADAAKRLQMAIARLRKAIDGDGANTPDQPALQTVGSGYLLAVGRGELDSDVFESNMREGRRVLDAGEPSRAAALLREALGLWRGPALADVAYAEFAQAEIRRLEELQLAALEARIEADLRLGLHGAVIGELDALVAREPLRERLHGQRMLALYRSGRQADALEAYQQARRVLVEQIGVAPGPQLERLQQAILAHDPVLETVDVGRRELSGGSRPELLDELRSRAGAATQRVPPVRRPIVLPLPRALGVASELRFVGRDQELARLHELWANRPREATAAFVAGEAGIGKTRLASELASAVHREGALVLYGRCDEGLGVPYQPWVEALRPVAGAMGIDRIRAELGRLSAELARLFPELDTLGRATGADPETERYALFEAVAALIETVTQTQRVLLMLDDLHWAARPTLLLLRHLMRSERRPNAFVLGTYRETELPPDHPLPQLLADLQRDAGATTVRIGGLDERETAVLLESAVGDALDDRAADFAPVLRTQTGGNPFFIRELLAHLLESGEIERVDDPWTTDLAAAELEVPERLRHVIRQRVARLSEPARRALDVAAVAGPTFAVSALEVALSEQSGLLDGLDEAVSAGLLEEAEPGEYAFAHALVHQTIYEGHGAARRMRLHRRLGEALEAGADADAHIEALAYHFAQCAADGQATKAAAYALAAGRRAAARLAYEDAAAHYEQGLHALQLAPELQDRRRGELLLALVAARWASGDMEEARRVARRAAELADRRGDPAELARAALGYAGPARFEMAAATGPGTDLLERTLGALGDRDSRLRARVMARLASAVAFGAPEQRRPALAYEALAMARRLGDRRTLMEVLATSHMARWRPDNLAERRATASELAGFAAASGDGALEAVARRWTVTNLLELGAIDEAEGELALYDRLAHTLHQRYPKSLAVGSRGQHAFLAGRLEHYEALAHEGLALGLGDESATLVFLAQMVFLRREQRRLGEVVDAVLELVERYPAVPAWRCVVAFVYAGLDRPRDAQREVEALASNDFADLPRDFLWLVTLALLSDVVASIDDPLRAEQLYPLLLPFADRCAVADGPFYLGSVSRPLGGLATTMRLFEAAAHHFEDALEMNAKTRSALWIAHTQHDYARMLERRHQRGDRERAVELLAAALATADRLGLTALTARALPLMRQVRSSARTRPS
jgi:DNA-binding SARP family transcriptional activator